MYFRKNIPPLHYGILFLIIFLAFMYQNRENFRLAHNIHPLADGFSEANAYRGALNYNRDGFTSRAGLPKIYGEEFRQFGRMARYTKQNISFPAPEEAYTHMPQGPEVLLGIMTKVFGPGKMPYYRLLPTVLALGSLLFLGISLLNAGFHISGVAFFLIGMLAMPAFGMWIPALHYQSYHSSIWLIFVGIYLRFLFKEDAKAEQWASKFSFSFLALGLTQGFFGLDWVFITCFSTIPLWFFYAHFNAQRSFQKLFRPTLLLVLGFILAQLIHFVQVCIYYGSVQEALMDLTGTAQFRSQGNVGGFVAEYLLGPLPSMAQYIYNIQGAARLFPRHFFIIPLIVIICLSLTRRILGRDTSLKKGAFLQFRLTAVTFWMFFSALALPSLWILVMPQHAQLHWWFTGRHFLLYYLILLFFFLFIMEPDFKLFGEKAMKICRSSGTLISVEEESDRFSGGLLADVRRVFTKQPPAVVELVVIAVLSVMLLLGFSGYPLSKIVVALYKHRYVQHLPKCHETSIPLSGLQLIRKGETNLVLGNFMPACLSSAPVYMRIDALPAGSDVLTRILDAPFQWEVGKRKDFENVFQTTYTPAEVRVSLVTKWTDTCETTIPINYNGITGADTATISKVDASLISLDRYKMNK